MIICQSHDSRADRQGTQCIALLLGQVHSSRYRLNITLEFLAQGNGAIDLVAEKSGEQIAIEVETGKSDIPENLKNALEADMDSIVLVATSATAVTACQKAIDDCTLREKESIKLMTWLDMT